MDSLLTKQGILVNTDFDRVALSVGRSLFVMPYAETFKIAAALRLGAKRSMRESGESISYWRDMSKLEAGTIVNEYRHNGLKTDHIAPKRFDWEVSINGEMVYLLMDDTEIGFHFTETLKIANWLRLAGRKAKKWAGDTSRTLSTVGILSNAEANY